MTTAAPSTALVTIQPAFTNAERFALAGFPAGYRGLTRDAYALDLRQFSTWCRARSLALFAVRRADIESFARELEARGRAATTVGSALDLKKVLAIHGSGLGRRGERAVMPSPAASSARLLLASCARLCGDPDSWHDDA
jgi:Phage integrase, N-terminal SAM-like domain